MKAGTCIAFFVIIFTCFQFSLWARYGNAWTAGNRFARRGYTTLSQKKMNTTEHASGVLQNGSEFRFVSLPSHESRLVEKEIRVSSLRPSTADKHDSEVINVRRKKHARHMKIKVALFNDKLIETQWGSSALIAGHGFQGNIKCELVHSCNFEIIPSANTDPNKFRSFDGIVHMAAKPQGNRLVSKRELFGFPAGIVWLRKGEHFSMIPFSYLIVFVLNDGQWGPESSDTKSIKACPIEPEKGDRGSGTGSQYWIQRSST